MIIDTTELNKLIDNMGHRWSEVPEPVVSDCLDVLSKNVKKQIVKRAEDTDMLRTLDPKKKYNFNEITKAVFIKRKRDKYGSLIAEINFKGIAPRLHRQGGKARIAEIAFLNEYGVPTHYYQKPRPFIKESCEHGLKDSMADIEKILGKWLETFKK